MAMIDDRGRLFGRLNVVDAAIVLLLLVMIPIAYGAYWLFRDPPARLTAVMPATLTSGINNRVQVIGENFRPYMRVSFGPNQGGGFLFESTTSAFVNVPILNAGKYDVVLYDYAQEVSRLKDALTINAPTYPIIPITVGGAFTDLSSEQAARLEKGHPLPESGSPAATIVEVGSARPAVARISVGDAVLPVALQGPVDLPATISLSCVLQPGTDGLRRCFYNSIALGPGVNIGLTGLNTALNFQVSDIHYSRMSRTVRVHVRVSAPTDLSGQVKAGDRDIGAKAFAAGVMATLVSATPGGGPNGLTAVLSIEAEETATGWIYKGKPVKVGARITFETERYTMDGVITAAEFPPARP